MPVTSSVKRELPDLTAPRAIEENAEMVVTSVRPPGRGQPNKVSPNRFADQTGYFLRGYRTHYGMQVR